MHIVTPVHERLNPVEKHRGLTEQQIAFFARQGLGARGPLQRRRRRVDHSHPAPVPPVDLRCPGRLPGPDARDEASAGQRMKPRCSATLETPRPLLPAAALHRALPTSFLIP